MSKPNEDRDVYYIPPNFLTSGRLFGGMIRARNAIEACVLVLLTGVPHYQIALFPYYTDHHFVPGVSATWNLWCDWI